MWFQCADVVWLMGRLVKWFHAIRFPRIIHRCIHSSVQLSAKVYTWTQIHATPSICHHGYPKFNPIICSSLSNVCSRLQHLTLPSSSLIRCCSFLSWQCIWFYWAVVIFVSSSFLEFRNWKEMKCRPFVEIRLT